MRKIHIVSVVICVVFVFFISGCSSGKSNPVTVQPDSGIDSPIPLPETNAGDSNRNLLGTWVMQFNPETLVTTIEPNREVNRHFSVRSSIEPPTIIVTYWDPVTETVHISVTIENSSYLNVFDVRLIIYTDDVGHILSNADDWTGLWDIAEGLPINPFMAYAKTVTRRNFQAQASYTENLQIYCPDSNYDIQFAIDACFPGNCEEPYEISDFTQGYLYERTGASTDVEVTVLDWQENVIETFLHCPEITDELLSQFEQVTPQTWKLNLVNNAGVPIGEYTGYLVARSPNAGLFELFDRITITVSPDNEPPVWDSNIGIENARAGNESVNVYWETATDEGNPPVEYLLYMDDDNDPWDEIPIIATTNEPYTFTGLVNGQTYWFGVQCRDSASPPNVDTNTHVLSAIPQSGIPLNPQIVGSYKYSIRSPSRMVFYENYAYVCEGAGQNRMIGFAVLDISNPEEPEILGCTEVLRPTKICTNGEIVCCATYKHSTNTISISIIDITDPSNPNITSTLSVPGRLNSLSITGNTVCFGGTFDVYTGYMLLDVSNPNNPEIKSIVQTMDHSGIYALGDYAYYTTEDEGLKTVDISDPSNPEVVNSFYYGISGYDVFHVIPGYVMIKDYDGDFFFRMIDVRDPLNPVLADRGFVCSGTHQGLSITSISVSNTGNRLYFTYQDNNNHQMTVFDISNPYSIMGIGHTYKFYAYIIGSYEKYIFDGSGSPDSGLRIHDCVCPSAPEYIRTFWGFYPTSIDIKGEYAYCGIGDHHIIATIDISSPTEPNFVSEVRLGTNFIYSTHDVFVDGDYLYVADGTSGLKVLDISNPGYPELAASLELGGRNTLKIKVSGNNAFVVSEEYGLEIINISDPLSPAIDGYYAADDIQDVDIQGDYAYITRDTDNNYMQILDISDPQNPVLTGSLYDSRIEGGYLDVEGNYAYIGKPGASLVDLKIADISNPSNPELISTVDIYSACCCSVMGNYAYIGDLGCMIIYDISDPINPEEFSYVANSAYPREISIIDNHAYLARGGRGFQVVQLW